MQESSADPFRAALKADSFALFNVAQFAANRNRNGSILDLGETRVLPARTRESMLQASWYALALKPASYAGRVQESGRRQVR